MLKQEGAIFGSLFLLPARYGLFLLGHCFHQIGKLFPTNPLALALWDLTFAPLKSNFVNVAIAQKFVAVGLSAIQPNGALRIHAANRAGNYIKDLNDVAFFVMGPNLVLR